MEFVCADRPLVQVILLCLSLLARHALMLLSRDNLANVLKLELCLELHHHVLARFRRLIGLLDQGLLFLQYFSLMECEGPTQQFKFECAEFNVGRRLLFILHILSLAAQVIQVLLLSLVYEIPQQALLDVFTSEVSVIWPVELYATVEVLIQVLAQLTAFVT